MAALHPTPCRAQRHSAEPCKTCMSLHDNRSKPPLVATREPILAPSCGALAARSGRRPEGGPMDQAPNEWSGQAGTPPRRVRPSHCRIRRPLPKSGQGGGLGKYRPTDATEREGPAEGGTPSPGRCLPGGPGTFGRDPVACTIQSPPYSRLRSHPKATMPKILGDSLGGLLQKIRSAEMRVQRVFDNLRSPAAHPSNRHNFLQQHTHTQTHWDPRGGQDEHARAGALDLLELAGRTAHAQMRVPIHTYTHTHNKIQS